MAGQKGRFWYPKITPALRLSQKHVTCAVSKCLWHLYPAQAALTTFTAGHTFPNEPPSLCRAESQRNRMMGITSSQLGGKGFPSGSVRETWVQSLGWEDTLEEEMVTHSSILAWEIPLDRGAWWATVHGVAKSQIWLSRHAIRRKSCTASNCLCPQKSPSQAVTWNFGFPHRDPCLCLLHDVKVSTETSWAKKPKIFQLSLSTLLNAYTS